MNVLELERKCVRIEFEKDSGNDRLNGGEWKRNMKIYKKIFSIL